MRIVVSGILLFFLFLSVNSKAKTNFQLSDKLTEKTIIFLDKNISEARIIDKKNKKISFWYISNNLLQIEFIGLSKKYYFKIKKIDKENTIKISGFFEKARTVITSRQVYKNKIYFNEICLNNRNDFKTWIMQLQEKMKFTIDGDKTFFKASENCQNHKEKLTQVFETQSPEIEAALNCMTSKKQSDSCQNIECKSKDALIQKALVKYKQINIEDSSVKITCTDTGYSNYKAFFIEQNPALYNFDPSLFEISDKKNEKLIENVMHEIFHAAGEENEEEVKRINANFMANLNSKSCQKEVVVGEAKLGETTQIVITSQQVLGAHNTLSENINNEMAPIEVTTNPVAAQSVQETFNREMSIPSTASLNTPQGQAKYIKDTEPSRRSALTWANNVVNAVIPSAVAATGTTSSSASTRPSSSSTRNIASITDSPNQNLKEIREKSERVKINTPQSESSKVATETPQKSSNSPTTELGTTNKVTPSSKISSGVAPVNQDGKPKAESQAMGDSLNTSTSGVGNNSYSESSKSSVSNSSVSVVEFIQTSDYRSIKQKFIDDDFRDDLIKANVKIITLDGQVIGAKNGKIIFTDRGQSFVRETR